MARRLESPKVHAPFFLSGVQTDVAPREKIVSAKHSPHLAPHICWGEVCASARTNRVRHGSDGCQLIMTFGVLMACGEGQL